MNLYQDRGLCAHLCTVIQREIWCRYSHTPPRRERARSSPPLESTAPTDQGSHGMTSFTRALHHVVDKHFVSDGCVMRDTKVHPSYFCFSCSHTLAASTCSKSLPEPFWYTSVQKNVHHRLERNSKETNRFLCIRHVFADARSSIHNHFKSVRIKVIHVRVHVNGIPRPGSFQGETTGVQGFLSNKTPDPMGTKSCLWPLMVTLSARSMPVILRVLEKSAGPLQAASTWKWTSCSSAMSSTVVLAAPPFCNPWRNTRRIHSVSFVMSTLMQALRLSIENVSGSTRLSGMLNRKFSRICESNVDSSFHHTNLVRSQIRRTVQS